MPRRDSSRNLEILEHLPQGIFILCQDETVAFWNHCLEEWTGLHKATIEGSRIDVHFPHLGTPKYLSRLRPLFEGGPPATFASQFHPQFLPCSLPNGQARIQQTIARAIWDNSAEEWQALVIIQDISDLHRQVAESQGLRKQAQIEIRERKKAELAMADQNRLLALDAEIGKIITQNHEFQPLLQECTQAIVHYLDAHFARIWTIDPTQQILELQASAGRYTHLNGPHSRVPVGQYKIGQIAAEKKPHLTNAVVGDPRVSDQEWAKQEGLIAFAGYPLLQDDEVLGVLAMFSKNPLTDLTLDTLKKIGNRLTVAIERQKYLQAHQELSLRYERILASAGEGIFGLDLEGRTTFANPAAAKMLKYKREELIGIPMHATIHHTRSDGSPYPRETCPMYAAFRDGTIHHIEDEVLWCKDGSSFPIAYTSRPIHDDQNQIVGAVVTFRDITERKQLEKAQADLQRAIDQGLEGLALLDQEGRYTYINPAHAAMYGYTVDELMGQSWKTLYSKEQLQLLEESCLPELRTSGKWEGELPGLRKDGTKVPVEISLSLLMNPDGSSDGLVCTCRDTTERKRAEERFRLVVETTPNGMIMVDTSGKIILVNQLTESLFGYSRAELLGQQIEILIPQSFRTEHSHHRATYISKQTKSPIMGKGRELCGLHKDGREIPIEVGLNPIETQEGLFILASVVDITERKSAEEQLQKNAAALEHKNKELVTARDQALAAVKTKSAFLSTMSHEIRTPLNGVIGMTDLIMDTELDIDQREMVQTVKNSGEFLLNIINDILVFSKIEAGKLDLEVIDFDIRLVLDEVIDVLAGKASEKNVELIGLVYANIPHQLHGDPGRLRQILFNLIGNAIKFTEQGEIVVRIELIDEQTEIPVLKFSVTDTGIGIPSNAQGGLFQSFTQADSSTTRKFGGTGLGLAICKQLVTLMQGDIGVTSLEGQGSAFWFTIPLAHSVSTPLAGTSCTSLTKRRVCIIESNDTIRFLLNHYAQSWGMHPTVARNGKEGLALLREETRAGKPFDVALLDHSLSDTIHEDGFSLATHIRQDPDLANIPLILLTTLGKRGEGKIAKQVGINGYLTKPIRHQQLHDCLTMVLNEDVAFPGTSKSSTPSLITRHTVEEARAHTQCHILLAEDNIVNQKVAVRMIRKLGHRVDVVDTGNAAVKALEHDIYDLVLMDCQMPEMDGLEATRKIREAESKNRQTLDARSEGQESGLSDMPDSSLLTPYRVPIIALTANALTGDRETCLGVGMDDFLSKPVRLEELSTMITKWLPHSTDSTSVDISSAESQNQESALRSTSLDSTILQSLQDLGGQEDPEFFLSLIQQFLEDLPRHCESIQQAIDQQDAETLTKAAHACKGSCRAVGATALSEISYTLESMGRQDTLANARATFTEWLQEQERTIQALEQEKKQVTSPPHSSHPA